MVQFPALTQLLGDNVIYCPTSDCARSGDICPLLFLQPEQTFCFCISQCLLWLNHINLQGYVLQAESSQSHLQQPWVYQSPPCSQLITPLPRSENWYRASSIGAHQAVPAQDAAPGPAAASGRSQPCLHGFPTTWPCNGSGCSSLSIKAERLSTAGWR